MCLGKGRRLWWMTIRLCLLWRDEQRLAGPLGFDTAGKCSSWRPNFQVCLAWLQGNEQRMEKGGRGGLRGGVERSKTAKIGQRWQTQTGDTEHTVPNCRWPLASEGNCKRCSVEEMERVEALLRFGTWTKPANRRRNERHVPVFLYGSGAGVEAVRVDFGFGGFLAACVCIDSCALS